jgi:hypothetical protein
MIPIDIISAMIAALMKKSPNDRMDATCGRSRSRVLTLHGKTYGMIQGGVSSCFQTPDRTEAAPEGKAFPGIQIFQRHATMV